MRSRSNSTEAGVAGPGLGSGEEAMWLRSGRSTEVGKAAGTQLINKSIDHLRSCKLGERKVIGGEPFPKTFLKDFFN